MVMVFEPALLKALVVNEPKPLTKVKLAVVLLTVLAPDTEYVIVYVSSGKAVVDTYTVEPLPGQMVVAEGTLKLLELKLMPLAMVATTAERTELQAGLVVVVPA